jgi:hypothetical protein
MADWFEIIILIILGLTAALLFANVVYFYRLSQSNALLPLNGTVAVTPAEATTMMWLNIVMFIVILLIFFWLIIRFIFYTDVVVVPQVAVAQPPVVVAAKLPPPKTELVAERTFTTAQGVPMVQQDIRISKPVARQVNC